ncbi:hypothetical protein F0562_000630 [Nyssa sinensis]|uniref:enoyl-CoA hydratase n=1 Tax=Nyssa sinensis TaxID=561372 RepID=A0A5J5C1Y5_9ASTE|nr:hypothetical protein F0562_000630 [Nyssa sinensis]
MGSSTKGRTVLEVGADGVALITIVNPPVNSLSIDVLQSLKESYELALRRDDVKAIVITGANGKFSGGFDITAFGGFQGERVSAAPKPGFISVEILTDTLEAARKPSVAAIDGLALGGGLEVAMACHARISTSNAQLGLPELQLGIIPGFGGTQRLPRLVGLSKALEMMLMSKPVKGEEAHSLGLVDAIVSPDELVSTARRWALGILERKKPWIASLYKTDKIEPLGEAREILNFARAQARKHAPNLKHPLVCIDVIEGGIVSGPRAGLWKEAEAFQGLLHSDTCKSLVHIFFAQRGTSKVPGITDLGLVPRRINKVESEPICKAADVDIVIEAVIENVSLKQQIFADLEKYCPPHCILASNTSTIDLNLIGEKTRSHDRIVGAHFFSPAHVMPLLEIVRTQEDISPRCSSLTLKLLFCLSNMVQMSIRLIGQSPNLECQWARLDCVIWLVLVLQSQLASNLLRIFPERTCKSMLIPIMQEDKRAGETTRKGFYVYDDKRKASPDPELKKLIQKARDISGITVDPKLMELSDKEIVEMIFFPVVNEACRVLSESIAVKAADLDIAAVMGMGFPPYRGGIMFWADSLGSKYICSRLEEWSNVYGGFFKPCAYLTERAAKGALLSYPVEQAKSRL